MTMASKVAKVRNIPGGSTGAIIPSLKRCPRIAPQAYLAPAVIDRYQEFRKQPIADSRRGHIRKPDVDIAEIDSGDLHASGSPLFGSPGTRQDQRVGRSRVDDCRHHAAVDDHVDYRGACVAIERYHSRV